MQHLPLIIALILMGIAVTGRNGRLFALAVAWVTVFPAVKYWGIRSAIWAPDLVVAAAVIPWLLRSHKADLPNAPQWFGAHIATIIAWITCNTTVGLVVAGAAAEVPYRVPMAAARMAAPLLSFCIAASCTLSSREFTRSLTGMRLAFVVLVILSLGDYLGLLPWQFFFRAYEESDDSWADISDAGYLTRSALGTLSLVGTYICVLSIQSKKGNRILNIAAVVGLLSTVLFCGSRSYLLALGAFGVALMLLQKGRRIRNAILVAIGAIAGFLLISNTPMVAKRFATLTSVDSAVRSSGRIEGYTASLGWMARHPEAVLMGVGYDCWGRRLTPTVGLHNGHNVYLHSLGELGLIGAAIYFAFFARLAWGFRRVMGVSLEGRTLGGTTLALMSGLALANLFTTGMYPLLTRMVALHTVMIALGLAYARARYLLAEKQLLQHRQLQEAHPHQTLPLRTAAPYA